MFLSVVVVIVTSPIAAATFSVFALVRFVLRRILDTITFGLLKCCARQPREDSWIAWKVAGPGVSKNFYQTMKEEDLYILVLAELERVRLELFQREVTDKLNQPIIAAKAMTAQFTTELNTVPSFI